MPIGTKPRPKSLPERKISRPKLSDQDLVRRVGALPVFGPRVRSMDLGNGSGSLHACVIAPRSFARMGLWAQGMSRRSDAADH